MTSFEAYTDLQDHFTKEQVLAIVNLTKSVATKDDLADCATKTDIAKLASKDDIKEILKEITKGREDMIREFSKNREDNTKEVSKLYQEIGSVKEAFAAKLYWTSFLQVLAIVGAIAAIVKFIIAK